MCDEYIEAAEHGYRFLKEKMWDTDNGAFYWEVDATGNEKLKPRKHLYSQSFALYAISEYFLATGRQPHKSLVGRGRGRRQCFVYAPVFRRSTISGYLPAKLRLY